MGSRAQRSEFRSLKPRVSVKEHERCRHTHEVHTAKSPQWCIIPPVIKR